MIALPTRVGLALLGVGAGLAMAVSAAAPTQEPPAAPPVVETHSVPFDPIWVVHPELAPGPPASSATTWQDLLLPPDLR